VGVGGRGCTGFMGGKKKGVRRPGKFQEGIGVN
jgi:hypothetical protein